MKRIRSASFFTPPNANDVTTPITVNNRGAEQPRSLHRLAEARFRDRRRHAHVGHRVQQHSRRSSPAMRSTSGRATAPSSRSSTAPISTRASSSTSIRTARSCASPRRPKAGCAGSAARTTCTRTGSSRPATCRTSARASSRCTASPATTAQSAGRRQRRPRCRSHLPRRLAGQRRLGGVRRRDLRDHRPARARHGRCATTRTSARTPPRRRRSSSR